MARFLFSGSLAFAVPDTEGLQVEIAVGVTLRQNLIQVFLDVDIECAEDVSLFLALLDDDTSSFPLFAGAMQFYTSQQDNISFRSGGVYYAIDTKLEARGKVNINGQTLALSRTCCTLSHGQV